MSILSLDKFLALVERSGLVDTVELARLAGDWKQRASLAQLDDAQPLADHLVAIGTLTRWQAKKLLDGRHRGFFLGKYKLLDHLGSGGMSSVYLAEHVLMQRLVAIKVLPQHRVGESTYLARFHLEAQCAAALDHRNIVRAYDVDNEGKIHYLVMEYVEGRDLQAIVSHDGPLDFHTAADCIAQAAAGLDHAHAAGLVHRDIKPANLLVDLRGTVKILDMGLAKFAAAKGPGADLAGEEQVLGTADYVAPEQAVNSSAVDHRADIYSLGCTLYFLLTGHPPFTAGTSAERLAAHRKQMAPSIHLDRPDAPEALVAICRRMMEKSPLNRYPTAADVHVALAAWLAAERTAGRARTGVLANAFKGAGFGGLGDRSGSKINLITGSNVDLESLSSVLPGLSSPLVDTDSNLHRGTEKIPGHMLDASAEAPPAKAAADSGALAEEPKPPSGASRPSEAPLAPPVAPPPAPPRARPLAEPPVAPVSLAGKSQPARASADEADPAPSVARAWRDVHRPASRVDWAWILVVSVLILASVLLGIFAFGN